jgi:myo-inositol-1(or 4)-monophosphatase
VIDPIDGTRSFILGQLHWATLIALHDGVRPIVGVTHQPFVGETFIGAPGLAQWRGQRATCVAHAPCARMRMPIVATTDPRHFASHASRPRMRAPPTARASCATAAIATATPSSRWDSSTS